MENYKDESKKIIRTFFSSENVVYVFFYITILTVMMTTHMVAGSDDVVYYEALQTMPMLQWVWMRATTWQPRIVSDFLLALFNFNFPIWRIITAGVVTLLLVVICKVNTIFISEKKVRIYLKLIVCCSFCIVFPHVLTASVFWYTGSFFYLYPMFFLLLAILPFYFSATKIKLESNFLYYVALPCSAFVAYMEQPAAIMLCFGLYVFVLQKVRKEKIPRLLLSQYVVTVLNVLIYFAIGGTGIRQEVELYWYPDYPMLTIIDRIFQGVNWGNYQFFNASNLFILVFTGVIFLTIVAKYSSIYVRLFGSLPFGISLASIFPFDFVFSKIAYSQKTYQGEYHLEIGNNVNTLLNSMLAVPANMNLEWMELIPSFICFTIILFIGCLLYFVFENKLVAITNVVLYLAALCSSYALSFSPTIFASGNRIFFVTDILILFLTASVLQELFHTGNIVEKKWFKILVVILISLAICFALEHFSFNLSGNVRY